MKAHKQFSNYVRLSFETDLICLNGNVRDMELPNNRFCPPEKNYFKKARPSFSVFFTKLVTFCKL